jgi:hypothetical protein
MAIIPAEILVGLMAMIIVAHALYKAVKTIIIWNIVPDLLVGINLFPIALWLAYSQLIGHGNFVELIAANARRTPNKEALVFTADGRRYTYKQLNDEINRTASWMMSQGIKPKHMVALMMENTPEFIIIWMAALKACFPILSILTLTFFNSIAERGNCICKPFPKIKLLDSCTENCKPVLCNHVIYVL